jgi:hypothetical protein
MMWKHLSAASLGLILFACSGCSQTAQPGSAAQPDQRTSASARYVESVNTVSGSYTIDAFFSEDNKPFTINMTQAYARLVKNRADETKKDVLIVLTEKPVAGTALSVVDNDDAREGAKDLEAALGNRGVRGVVFRLALDRKAAAEIEEKIQKLTDGETGPSETELREAGDSEPKPFFKGMPHQMGFELEVKSFSAETVEGRIKREIPEGSDSSMKADINFTVKLQPDTWTGGVFHKQPATKLEPGRASGEFEIDGKPVKINHAYARLVQYDFFDNQNTFQLWLTEKPVDQAALGDDSAPKLLAMKRAGNSVVLAYSMTGASDRNDVNLWQVKQVPDDTGNIGLMGLRDLNDTVTGVEMDYVRFDKNAIEGRMYKLVNASKFGRQYKIDLLFNAALLPPAASDGPVTANEGGQALPAHGGDPGKAYLAAIEKLKSAKTFEQMVEVWQSVITAEVAEKFKRDLPSLSPEQRPLFSDALKPIENPRIVGGLIKGDKATLRVTGTDRGEKALEVVNLHRENGQWKISSRHTRVE